MKHPVSRVIFSSPIAVLTLAASFIASALGRMSARAPEVLENYPYEMSISFSCTWSADPTRGIQP